MARQEKIITLMDGGNELTFKIRQMSATRMQSWILRALPIFQGMIAGEQGDISLEQAGETIYRGGLSMLQNLDYAKAEPLIDEMLACCSRVIGNVEEKCTRDSLDSYLEDMMTLIALEKEAFQMNLGFSLPEHVAGSGSPEKAPTSWQ